MKLIERMHMYMCMVLTERLAALEHRRRGLLLGLHGIERLPSDLHVHACMRMCRRASVRAGVQAYVHMCMSIRACSTHQHTCDGLGVKVRVRIGFSAPCPNARGGLSLRQHQ